MILSWGEGLGIKFQLAVYLSFLIFSEGVYILYGGERFNPYVDWYVVYIHPLPFTHGGKESRPSKTTNCSRHNVYQSQESLQWL